LHRGAAQVDSAWGSGNAIGCGAIFVHANGQRVVDVRQRFGVELDVDDVSQDLDYFAGGGHGVLPLFLGY
jgi:hypothetical protein